MAIASVGRAFPDNYYDQETLLAAFRRIWGPRLRNPARLESIHRNVLVSGRHLAIPMEAYEALGSFAQANDAYIRCAVDLGARAVTRALEGAGLQPGDVDHIFFTSVTGIATPSVDALLVGPLGLRPNVKRTPMFGLGCVAGTAGIARASDYLRAFPDQVAVLLSVELCSLTLQQADVSISNLIASGLFGDGAAAVVLTGRERRSRGPEVVATRSILYPGTEGVMGWHITERGFGVILTGRVPDLARGIRADVDSFLGDQGLELGDIDHFVCHPGGPKVLRAFQEALEVPADAFELTWQSLNQVGNLSSASVLMVLGDTLEKRNPEPEQLGLMISMGPGFCSELVLLRW